MDANHLSYKNFKGNLFVISAPSGAGKTSLIKSLLEKVDNITTSISHTTRSPRKGEIEGEDYYFVSKKVFEDLIAKGSFLEYAEVFGNYYGTCQNTVETLLGSGKDVILEIDWQGAEAVQKICHPISIFILPPSLSALKDRLTGRATDTKDVINKRLAQSVSDIKHYKKADYIVINDNFEQAVTELISIVKATRANLHNIKMTHSDLLDALEV